MAVYADTSFLISYYLPDPNSQRALAAVRSLSTPILFTALHMLELQNALASAIFRGRITSAQVQLVHEDLATDLQAGLLLAHTAKWYSILRKAAALSVIHTPVTGCRSLDVFHVAAAQTLAANEFYSFDTRQRSLAQLVGLTVQPR
jgi:predicted nucleic acid-binding protein